MEDNGYTKTTGNKLKSGDIIYGYVTEDGLLRYVNGYIVRKVKINRLFPKLSVVYISSDIDEITGHTLTKVQSEYYLKRI